MGHSPSEASQFGKPVIMGPHSEKCDAQIKDLVWSGGAIQIDKGPKMNENFLNNVVELLGNSERLEDMGRNSLIASGYAQQRADEASINLIELLKTYKSKLKVVCIGNMTVGGTGKTPFSIYTFKILKNLGYNPVFLTRGYGGLKKGPIEVNNSHHFQDVGDESILLSKIGTTIVSRNRSLGAKFNEKQKGKFNIIIMDDGLQNYQLRQDIKFLLVDKKLKLGNGYCLPAGPLRQPIERGLNNIDKIILTGESDNNEEDLFKSFNIPVIKSNIKTTNLPKIKKEKLL